ncbi:MAG: YqeG family HAD IIIA-type phosphatase [Cyanobacteria bacterium P01_H01_bin.121]
MAWHQLLQPDLMLAGSVFELTLERLQAYPLRGLMLDIDETLLPSSLSEASPELQAWLQTLKPHYKIWLVTNNLNVPRIRRIAQDLDLPYLLGAAKPSYRKLKQAALAMDLPLDQIAMIGDRLFTDVLAGNRLGVMTILVKPVGHHEAVGQSSWFHYVETWMSAALFNLVQPEQLPAKTADFSHPQSETAEPQPANLENSQCSNQPPT